MNDSIQTITLTFSEKVDFFLQVWAIYGMEHQGVNRR